MDTILWQLFYALFFGFCFGALVMHVVSRRKLESDIQVTSSRAGNRHVGLSWKDTFPKVGMGSIEYIVLRKDGLLSPWRERTVTRKLNVIDADVAPGKHYWYKVCGSREAVKGNSFRASDRLKVTA